MQIIVSDIPIEIQRKKIKHIYLYVKRPYGKVIISAPKTMEMSVIETFVEKKLVWIKKQIQKLENSKEILLDKQYVSGEPIHIWGHEYCLEFREIKYKNSFELQENKLILSMKAETTAKRRESYIREQYRLMLVEAVKNLLPKWETITGIKCDSWQTKYMVSRWGTCNVNKKKLWFNVQLAQKPKLCLEYIILHELVHLKERGHNDVFYSYMDRYMPNWRDVRKTLNNQ